MVRNSEKHSKLRASIEDLIRTFEEDENGLASKIFGSTTGPFTDFACSFISGFIDAPTKSVKEILCSDASLRARCFKLKREGFKRISKTLGEDIFMGGSIITKKDGEDGVQKITKQTVSPDFFKKITTMHREPEESLITNAEEKIEEDIYGASTDKSIIRQSLIDKAIVGLMPYQFGFFKKVEEFINNDSKSVFYYNLQGGYQCGKTTAINTILGWIINILANSDGSAGSDIMLFSKTQSALRRNVINRICATFGLTAPATNQTVWKVGKGLTIYLVTTALCSYHQIKGSSLRFMYIDEIDSVHPDVLDLLRTRLTGNFKVNGVSKTLFLSTNNPKSPNHFITKFLESDDVHQEIVSTRSNSFIDKDYLEKMINRCGGEGTNKTKVEVDGYSMNITTEHSVFPIDEDIMFIHDTIDSCVNQKCEEHKSNNSYDLLCKVCDGIRRSSEYGEVFKVSIGYDFGTAVQKSFVTVAFCRGISNNVTALALDELVYKGGHDNAFMKTHGLDALRDYKDQQFCTMIYEAQKLSPHVEVIIPHDCPHQVDYLEGLVRKYNLDCTIARTARKEKVIQEIDFMRSILQSGQLKISSHAPNLQQQLYDYQYDVVASEEHGEEKILKRNDHCVDALRYAIIGMKNEFSN